MNDLWTRSDDDFYTACEHMKLPFSITTYEKIKNLSFVISSEDKDVSNYYMHRKVQEILIKTCQKPICDKYILYLKERLKDDSISLDYKVLKEYIKYGKNVTVELALNKIPVISEMAKGIDIYAHTIAINNNNCSFRNWCG